MLLAPLGGSAAAGADIYNTGKQLILDSLDKGKSNSNTDNTGSSKNTTGDSSSNNTTGNSSSNNNSSTTK